MASARLAVPMFATGRGCNHNISGRQAGMSLRGGISQDFSGTQRSNRRPRRVDPDAETEEESNRHAPHVRGQCDVATRDSAPISGPSRRQDVPSPQHQEHDHEREQQHWQQHPGQYGQLDIRQRAALAQAFRSRVKALCRVHLRDCHQSWILQKHGRGMDAILEGLLDSFRNYPHWDWGKVVREIGRRQRRRRNLYRSEAAKRGARKPGSCTRASWEFFVAEAREHRMDPTWNARQINALRHRRPVPNRLGSGGKDSFINAFIHRYNEYPQLEFIRRANEVGSKAFFEEYESRFGSPLQGSDGSSSAGDS